MGETEKTTEQPVKKRLYRSRADRFIAGVCGGLGEYFDVDANVFRLLFIFLTLFGGSGLILYLAALIIVPENPYQETPEKPRSSHAMFWGLLLISLGIILILRQIGFFYLFNIKNLPWSFIWAVFLIILGIILIFSQSRKRPPASADTAEDEAEATEIGITRSRKDRMIAGVCGGIAHYFNIDSSLVRLLWVLATLASVGLGVLVYIILIFVFPEEPEEESVSG